ncbi:Protein RIK [Senna tora]|uniref:Protein RIK n=1 Tax=Senna tora TaxID=362788 RepID=A0A834T0F6_9FABA|nr:Protein RIK [Senna tora]
MVEEMLRKSQNSPLISSTSTSHLANMANGVKVLSTCVFLGFDADPSLNIVARIRGPNAVWKYRMHTKSQTPARTKMRSGTWFTPGTSHALHSSLGSITYRIT